MERETTTDKQGARRATSAGPATQTVAPELAVGPLPAGGLTSEQDLGAMVAGDLGSRARMFGRLQQGAGNGAAGFIAASAQVHRIPTRPAAGGETVLREDEEAETVYDVTENIGPLAESSYTVTADTLAGFASVVAARSEAGSVSWQPNRFSYTPAGSSDPPTVTVTVTVPINLQMPSWQLPDDMGPRTRAEYQRWYAALRAHEQGHIDLVNTHTEGLGDRLARSGSLSAAQTLFNTVITGLQTASDEYDTTTDHGLNTGTELDLSIEEDERGESDEEEQEEESAE